MDDIIEIEVISPSKQKYIFNYDDDYNAISIACDKEEDDPKEVYKEFLIKKNTIKSKAMQRLLEKAKNSYEDSVILKCTNKDGVKFDITIFDGPETYIAKRQKYYKIKYNEERIKMDTEEYYKILDEVIRDYVIEIMQEEKSHTRSSM